MIDFFEHCYGQTLELKRDSGLIKAEFTLAHISLIELKNHLTDFLHPEELAYFNTLAFERRQLGYLLGRLVAKQAVARTTPGAPLHDILIRNAVFHFPVVYYSSKENIQVTDSHTDQYGVALAFPEIHPMGIDLELVDAERNEVIESQLTEEEKTLIKMQENQLPETLLTLFWTLKESISKVLRTGLTSPFEIYAVKNIKFERGFWKSEFKNFTQYQAISFPLRQFVCTIVYPRRSELTIDIPDIQNWLERK